LFAALLAALFAALSTVLDTGMNIPVLWDALVREDLKVVQSILPSKFDKQAQTELVKPRLGPNRDVSFGFYALARWFSCLPPSQPDDHAHATETDIHDATTGQHAARWKIVTRVFINVGWRHMKNMVTASLGGRPRFGLRLFAPNTQPKGLAALLTGIYPINVLSVSRAATLTLTYIPASPSEFAEFVLGRCTCGSTLATLFNVEQTIDGKRVWWDAFVRRGLPMSVLAMCLAALQVDTEEQVHMVQSIVDTCDRGSILELLRFPDNGTLVRRLLAAGTLTPWLELVFYLQQLLVDARNPDLKPVATRHSFPFYWLDWPAEELPLAALAVASVGEAKELMTRETARAWLSKTALDIGRGPAGRGPTKSLDVGGGEVIRPCTAIYKWISLSQAADMAAADVAAAASVKDDVCDNAAAAAALSAPAPSHCAICLTGDAQYAVLPCGHLCLCTNCLQSGVANKACPLCRSATTSLVRIFPV
jgi:hypothetical protein